MLYVVENVKQENRMKNKQRSKSLIDTLDRVANTFRDMKEFTDNIVKEICLREKVPSKQVRSLYANKSVRKTEEDVTEELLESIERKTKN